MTFRTLAIRQREERLPLFSDKQPKGSEQHWERLSEGNTDAGIFLLSSKTFAGKQQKKIKCYLEVGLCKGLAGNRLPHNMEKYCKEESTTVNLIKDSPLFRLFFYLHYLQKLPIG